MSSSATGVELPADNGSWLVDAMQRTLVRVPCLQLPWMSVGSSFHVCNDRQGTCKE